MIISPKADAAAAFGYIIRIRSSKSKTESCLVWIALSRDLRVTSRQLVGSFDDFSLLKRGTGAEQGDEVGCVDGTLSGLCGLDELERHRDSSSSARTGSLGDRMRNLTVAKVIKQRPACGAVLAGPIGIVDYLEHGRTFPNQRANAAS
jgi:hypothetical protein